MQSQLAFFVSIAFSLIAWGIVTTPIYLAEASPPLTGRSIAAFTHPPLLPFHRISISCSRSCVA